MTDQEAQVTSDADASDADMDAWGGQETQASYVPRPRSEDDCIVKVDGVCTCVPGFERCEEFARVMQRLTAEVAEHEGM